MRKYILLIIALCLHIAARGQTTVSLDDIDLSGLPQPTEAKALRYWFDDETTSVRTTTQLSGTYALDVSSLSEGLHTLHYQVIDTDDGVAYIGGGVFMKAPSGSGLSVKTMRYWFDDDAASIQTAGGTTGTYILDVSGLSDGLHTLHYQLMGEGGTAGFVGSGLFMNTGSSIGTETVRVQKLMYWYDDDTTTHVADLGGGLQFIDASGLTAGLHTIHYQALCTNGLMTPAKSSFFMLIGTESDGTVATSLRYWFDDELTAAEVEITEGVQLLNTSALNDGLHTVHYQIVDSKRTLGAPYSAIFLKMDIDTESTTAKQLRYWFDESREVMLASLTGTTQTLDASALSDGMHTVHYFIVDNKGMAAAPRSAIFMKLNIDDEATTAKQLRYWFDDEPSAATVTTVAGGTQTLDVSALPTGLHTLSYQLIDSKGRVGVPSTRIFMKNFDKVLADGHNRVMKYQYWLNMNSEAMQTVEIDAAVNPYTLIALLPMQKEPIQSSQFHFEVTNDVPTIYAKNTLHVRFYDAQNYFTDGDKPFVDYSVKQEVTDAIPIYNGDRKTLAVPEKDAIHWFKFYAEEGDTVTFKTDQAASLQVFSPEGKEIYSAQGSTSVKYDGCHTWTDGTYYVALHDVTGSKPNISLDFTHLAKYDVVDYDVATVGNGGCSTITFKGNGFKDLYAVDFISAANDSIHSFSIGHESDGTTSVTADFTDAEIGKYTALFHFAEGQKYVYDAITVEEAKAIELATEVTFPRSFGHVVTYTCKITNNGNMTAYAVPVYTWLKSKTLNGISHIDYQGLDLRGVYDEIGTDTLSAKEVAALKAESERLGHDHYFLKMWTEDEENPGDSLFVRANYFFTNIAPNETKTLHLTLTMREVDAFAYFTVPKEWPTYSNIEETSAGSRYKVRHASESSSNWYCCYRERIECVANITTLIVDAATLVNPELGVADCALGWANQKLTAAGDTYCGKNDVAGDFAKRVNALTKTASAASTLLGCAGYGAASNVINAFLHPSVAINCVTAFFKKIPDCPPCIGCGDGGGSGGGSSHDPNEIYGYLAESGSKFMTDEVEKVNYRIEFENDTAFATRSALTVVIRDTLDSKLFDLATYAPTGIKIGEKVEFLDGEPNFVKTIDMRPEINGLVEVKGCFDASKGILTWTFTSIDPMTMEPTNDPMDGFLPVNVDGNGIGEITFDIGLKQKLAEGTEIPNRAGIVFDINDAILTPTWTNIVDATAPESHVADVQMATDSTAAVRITATDELSGPWHYDVYVQYGSGAWFLGAENVPIDSVARVKVYEGIDHGFYTLVTDSAGNVEQKEAAREFSFEVFAPQVDTDTKIELAEGWNWISHNQQEVLSAEALKPKAQRIVSQTDELYKDARFGWTGDLDELLPTELYKVQMVEQGEVQLSGKLFNAGFRSVPLYEGWNWVGYPVANTMSPAEALQKMEAEEGDFIVGQDGMATFTGGQWTGTLTALQPGQGYMYRSQGDKNLFLNATAQSSSRKANVQRSMFNVQYPEGWTVDKRKYPNVMGLVADLVQDGETLDANEWIVAAFCDEECRGLSQTVSGHLMMNVYGQGGERITFMALNRESGEVMAVEENEPFQTDILGTMQQPYELHSGIVTGIAEIEDGQLKNDNSVYDLQGRRVEKSSVVNGGVYIVTDGSNTKKHVNHKRNK